VNFRANSTFKPVDLSRLMQIVVPKIVAAVTEGCDAVATEAEAIVPVDTGELKASIGIGPVALVGNAVEGSVVATAPHAAYVEFGTGIRGAASAGVGPYPYSQSWPGMPASPYLRPALDTARPAIRDAFAKRGFKVS
jgi:hypothetical protein